MMLEWTRETLDNGLDVIVHEDRRCPIVAVNLWYHVGSRNECPGRTGLAHLFEQSPRLDQLAGPGPGSPAHESEQEGRRAQQGAQAAPVLDATPAEGRKPGTPVVAP